MYRDELFSRYAWAQDTNKLLPFMEQVRNALDKRASDWHPEGSDPARVVWLKMNMDGEPTLALLQQLPD